MKCVIGMPSAAPHGGAEEALMQFCRRRGEAGVELSRVIFFEPGPLTELVRHMGIEVEVVETGRLREPWKWVAAVGKIAGVLRGVQADVVLGWMTKAHLYTGPAALLAGVPGLYFQMGLPDGGLVDRLSRWLPARGALGCSEFVARAQAAASHHRVLPVALGAAVDGLGGGVKRTPAEARALLGLPVEGRLVGIVGRLQAWKGMHFYVEAMAALFRRFDDLSGVIVGGRHEWEPDYPQRLETQVAAAGLNERIRMVGRQENPALWMQAMDVVVHASDREPFGLVVVEAMSLGRPVVASVPGGPAEIVRDAVDGLLVPFGDTLALSAAIARLLDDGEFAKNCAANAAERSTEFTETRYAQRLGAALRELLGKR